MVLTFSKTGPIPTGEYWFNVMKQYWNCIFFIIRFFAPISFPPPVASAPSMSPYGQPPQSAFHRMAQAPPPTQQLTNQMSAMNIGGYGKLDAILYWFWRELTFRGPVLYPCTVIFRPKAHADTTVSFQLSSTTTVSNITTRRNGISTPFSTRTAAALSWISSTYGHDGFCDSSTNGDVWPTWTRCPPTTTGTPRLSTATR